MNENPLQGSFIIDELTDLVEEAVLAEFDRISERGGVLGAMETGYQRGRIQDESMLYEQRKHDGTPADHRRQHLPQPDADPQTGRDRTGPRHRGGEAVPAGAASATSRTATPARRPRALAALKEAAGSAATTCSPC